MIKSPFYSLLLLVFALSACTYEKGDAGQANLTLRFKGYYDGSYLKMFTSTYDFSRGFAKMRFQLFQFYISDVSLLTDGDSTQVLDIALVSFKNVQNDATAQEGITFSIKDIPPGKYRGIKIGLGVSPDLNAMGPSNYQPPHPLDDNYWSWAKGYVFTKIEGNVDADNSNTFPYKLTIHIGENPFYRSKTILSPFEIKPGDNVISLGVDLYTVMRGGIFGGFPDYKNGYQNHTTNLEHAKFFSDNLPAAITLLNN
jgi:hypothetical protein